MSHHLPTPMSAADDHAANAEEHVAKGLFIPAAEEHHKAAKAYSIAESHSHDEGAKRTVKLLSERHEKAGNDLDKKIAKMKEEGRDPSIPQKVEPPRTSYSPKTSRAISRHIPFPSPQRLMTDSQNTGDESFMLLAGQGSDPGDAFNQFWTIMQGMLDKLSQPVAFATIPLGDTPQYERKSTSSSFAHNDTSMAMISDLSEEPLYSRVSRRIGINRVASGKRAVGTGNKSTVCSELEESDEDLFDEVIKNELSGSFFVIPSRGEPSADALKKENSALKVEVDLMKKRIAQFQQVIQQQTEQDIQLRNSIVQATKEAQRVMGQSAFGRRPTTLDCSNLHVNGPQVASAEIGSKRDHHYSGRLRELDEELRLLREENEKNKAIILKFRERWEKLKDSAKRKKEAKSAAETTVNAEKIVKLETDE